MTANTALYRCSATLISFMKRASRISRRSCQPSSETSSSIRRSPNVNHQPNPYKPVELARGLEPLTACLQDRCATNCATPARPGASAADGRSVTEPSGIRANRRGSDALHACDELDVRERENGPAQPRGWWRGAVRLSCIKNSRKTQRLTHEDQVRVGDARSVRLPEGLPATGHVVALGELAEGVAAMHGDLGASGGVPRDRRGGVRLLLADRLLDGRRGDLLRRRQRRARGGTRDGDLARRRAAVGTRQTGADR